MCLTLTNDTSWEFLECRASPRACTCICMDQSVDLIALELHCGRIGKQVKTSSRNIGCTKVPILILIFWIIFVGSDVSRENSFRLSRSIFFLANFFYALMTGCFYSIKLKRFVYLSYWTLSYLRYRCIVMSNVIFTCLSIEILSWKLVHSNVK